MPTYRFQQIKRSSQQTKKCTCGKRFRRTISTMHTVNPYNKDAAGIPKSAAQVSADVTADLRVAIAKFQSEELCTRCTEEAKQKA